MEKPTTQTASKDRPQVSVRAVTANTCEVVVSTEAGDVRLICSHDAIEIDARGVDIRVRP